MDRSRQCNDLARCSLLNVIILPKTGGRIRKEFLLAPLTSQNPGDNLILISFWRLFAQLLAVFLAELLNPAGSINNLLLACVKRMTLRTYLDIQWLVHSRTRFKFIAATASHGYFLVIWMNVCFHCLYP